MTCFVYSKIMEAVFLFPLHLSTWRRAGKSASTTSGIRVNTANKNTGAEKKGEIVNSGGAAKSFSR